MPGIGKIPATSGARFVVDEGRAGFDCGIGVSDGFAEMGEALFAERFGVGHD